MDRSESRQALDIDVLWNRQTPPFSCVLVIKAQGLHAPASRPRMPCPSSLFLVIICGGLHRRESAAERHRAEAWIFEGVAQKQIARRQSRSRAQASSKMFRSLSRRQCRAHTARWPTRDEDGERLRWLGRTQFTQLRPHALSGFGARLLDLFGNSTASAKTTKRARKRTEELQLSRRGRAQALAGNPLHCRRSRNRV